MNSTQRRAVLKQTRQGAAAAGSGLRDPILLVEDDPDTRLSLQMILGRNYEIVGLSSGNQILEMLDSFQPVLVILDVDLPGKNGFELCRMIRSSARHRHLPVMFLTAMTDDASFVSGVHSNADAYLNKPFEVEELKDTVDRLVGSR